MDEGFRPLGADADRAPGTERSFEGYIRPPREKLEEDAKAFSEFIYYGISRKKLTQTELIEGPLEDKIDKSTFSRWLTSAAVPREDRRTIIKYIYDERKLFADDWTTFLNNVPEPAFHALLKFFNVKTTSIDNARGHIVGSTRNAKGTLPTSTYALWRYSVDDEDEFVFGKLEFTFSEETGAIHVDMYQPKKAITPSDNQFGQRASHELFTGYFFRVSDVYLLFLKDLASDDIRVTIFNKYRIEWINSSHTDKEKRLVQLDGHCLGLDGNSLFGSPVYIELVESSEDIANMDQAMDILPESKVPPRILKRLRRYKLFRE